MCSTESSAGTLAHEGAVARDVGYSHKKTKYYLLQVLRDARAAVMPGGRFPSHAEPKGDKNHRKNRSVARALLRAISVDGIDRCCE